MFEVVGWLVVGWLVVGWLVVGWLVVGCGGVVGELWGVGGRAVVDVSDVSMLSQKRSSAVGQSVSF